MVAYPLREALRSYRRDSRYAGRPVVKATVHPLGPLTKDHRRRIAARELRCDEVAY